MRIVVRVGERPIEMCGYNPLKLTWMDDCMIFVDDKKE